MDKVKKPEVCVCVCVCEGERERKRETKGKERGMVCTKNGFDAPIKILSLSHILEGIPCGPFFPGLASQVQIVCELQDEKVDEASAIGTQHSYREDSKWK